MRKYKLLGAIAVASLITGTSLMAGEDGNATYFGTESYAADTSVAFGTRAGEESIEGNGAYNTMIGYQSGMLNKGGSENTYVGHESGYSAQQQGSSNVAIGAHSGRLGAGSNNVMIGKNSGLEANANASIYIGDGAGKNNHRDETLIIDNNGYDGFSPLIYGEFDNSMLRVNGTMEVNGTMMTTFDAESTLNVTELVALSVNNTDLTLMSDVGFKLTNTKESVAWTFRTLEEDALMGDIRNGFAISKKDSGAKELIITAYDSTDGMELILGNGAKNTGGTWVNASSRSLKENIETLDTEAAIQAFSKLQPVTYNYKINKDEKFVGFIAEDVPELVAMNSRDGLSSMDMVAVLTKVVQETRTEAKAKDEKIAIMEEKIAKLETMQKRLARLESLLTNLALDTSKATKEKVTLK